MAKDLLGVSVSLLRDFLNVGRSVTEEDFLHETVGPFDLIFDLAVLIQSSFWYSRCKVACHSCTNQPYKVITPRYISAIICNSYCLFYKIFFYTIY